MRKWLLSLLILLLLIPAMPITAQEIGSPEDNACNPGGAMYRENPAEGCNSEWHWVCGYYLARFYTRSYNMGGYDTSLVPDWCASLLPPRPQVPAAISVEATRLCFTDGFFSYLYTGPANTAGNFTAFSNTTCSGVGEKALDEAIIIAGSSDEAQPICDDIFDGDTELVVMLSSDGFNAPNTYWICEAD